MKVRDLGEFNLINFINEIIGNPEPDMIQVGIGDDAAAWQSDSSTEMCTIDTLVEGIHFNLDYTGYAALGWKCLAVNLSDIAAMGGTPMYALVSLGLPGKTDVDNVKHLYQGMLELAEQHRVIIAGGDIVRSPQLSISIAVIGRTTGENILKRSAAATGELLAVTGELGSSAAGLEILKGKRVLADADAISVLHNAHLMPKPRIAEGQLLVKHGIRAAIDLSDGLLNDLGHICDMSAVGAEIYADKIPVHHVLTKNFGQDSLRLALTGGEDYELLFCAPQQSIDAISADTDTQITVIGRLTTEHRKEVLVLDADGKPVDFDKKGWDHFL